jgi:ribosomal protein S6--L-glutamate ligase
MRHLILTNSPNSNATKRLIEEIKKRKDDHEVIDPSDLYAYISSTTSGHDRIFKKTEKKSERILSKSYDSIIPRIGGKGFDHSVMILKQLSSNLNIFSTGSERGHKICSNKFLTAQILSKHKIRNPKQVLAFQPNDFKEIIDLVGGLPAVAKLQRGSKGLGVMILNDALAASTSLSSFQSLGASVIIQKFIDSGKPANDLRIFVVGPETKKPKIFAYKRYALDSDFRSNLSISGLGEKVTITDEEREMAINAALAVQLGVCGVDIIRDSLDNNKPYLVEVNSTPGFGIEGIIGENVAGAIIDYVRENYKKKSGFNSGANAHIEQTFIEAVYNNLKTESTTHQPIKTPNIINRTKATFKNGKLSISTEPIGQPAAPTKPIKKSTIVSRAVNMFKGKSYTNEEISQLTPEQYAQLDAKQRFLYEAEKAENI